MFVSINSGLFNLASAAHGVSSYKDKKKFLLMIHFYEDAHMKLIHPNLFIQTIFVSSFDVKYCCVRGVVLLLSLPLISLWCHC